MQTGRMSRMTTSFASFSCARPAMQRACSSEVSVRSIPFRSQVSLARSCGWRPTSPSKARGGLFSGGTGLVPLEPPPPGRDATRPRSSSNGSARRAVSRARVSPVQLQLLDEGRNSRRNEIVDGLAGRDAPPGLARGRLHSGDLEQLDAIRLDRLGPVPGTRRNPKARQLEHGLRLLPGAKPDELVGTDQKDRAVPFPRAQHVDRAWVRIELDLVTRKGRGRQLHPRLRWSEDGLVPGRLRDEDHK